jgi:leucyl-tRNA synthetase
MKHWVKHVKKYSKVHKLRGKETLRFGSEVWTLTKDKKTGCLINMVPRTTCGCYRDKLHVEVIEDQLRKISIVKHTEKHKLRWAEQFERMTRKVMIKCIIYDPETEEKLEDRKQDGRNKFLISERAQVFLPLVQ